ncbi:zinc ribbon domain-containing protein [Photobacterium sp. SDRW27]|uniref:zinc ribbon domain-containing protein n=1 Tax=Photobacterium obscurum TaxID=2829490 RepID=UPI002243D568|nr:zinc ribbon domain-containing protein [Photobacterium obscurum]MCW8328053.1 zinc ribbon domain-containing protein [Photobacterium obscurum]
MSDNICPDCQCELSWKENRYYCESCQHPVNKRAFCPDCDAELEKLQACGSASYFCNSCNELKSKSRVKVVFEKA